ncbi:MAG TPA: urocanate hydratase, partial [Pantoea agglomerans]|nr:urocanate hydratase [Pantoea agglomerans]
MSETLSQAVAREIRAPHGTTLHCANWLIEAAYRMIQNNLDPDVAERPEDLVDYGGIGDARRKWEGVEESLGSPGALQPGENLLIQSGKALGTFRTHADARREPGGNSNLQPHGAPG